MFWKIPPPLKSGSINSFLLLRLPKMQLLLHIPCAFELKTSSECKYRFIVKDHKTDNVWGNIVTRSRNHFCRRNRAKRSFCVLLNVRLTVTGIKVLSCLGNATMHSLFVIVELKKIFVSLVTVWTYSSLRVKCAIFVYNFKQIWSSSLALTNDKAT
jgi:hypothetical protein